MEGLEPSAEEEDEMQYDEDDDEGIEEDLEDEGTLGMDRLQVHTVDLSEAAAPDGEAAQAGHGASPSAAAPSSTRAQRCTTILTCPLCNTGGFRSTFESQLADFPESLHASALQRTILFWQHCTVKSFKS